MKKIHSFLVYLRQNKILWAYSTFCILLFYVVELIWSKTSGHLTSYILYVCVSALFSHRGAVMNTFPRGWINDVIVFSVTKWPHYVKKLFNTHFTLLNSYFLHFCPAVSVRETPAPWTAAPATWPLRPCPSTTCLCLPTRRPLPRCSAWRPPPPRGAPGQTACASASWAETPEASSSCSVQTDRPVSWYWSSSCVGRRRSALMWTCPSTATAPFRPSTWPGCTFWFHLIASERELEKEED